MDAPEDDWWTSFHVPELADLFLARTDPQELQQTVEFLKESLRLERGGRVYDQCCGIGSLGIALAKQDMLVTGADLCSEFVDRARVDAGRAGVFCEFHCADAFQFVPAISCDAVFNWYSSFGYATSDERNRRMLARAYEALRPGGRFALDVPNFPAVLRSFQPHIVRRGMSQGRPVVLIRESTMLLERGVLAQVWTWLIDGQPPVAHNSELRLYLPHQISDMLATCGFVDIRMTASIAGDELTLDSPRLICTATRPEK
jgi:SAM-dependent methyltransferase